MWVAVDHSIPWDRKDTELLTELVAQDRPARGTRFNSHRVLAVGQGRGPASVEPVGHKPHRNTFWE